MGFFDKLKTAVKGKDWLNNFSCPRCGSRVYKTGFKNTLVKNVVN